MRRSTATRAGGLTSRCGMPRGQAMKSPKRTRVSRAVLVAGHKTSVSLEDAFWNALREIAKERGTTVPRLVTSIKRERREANLSSAIRLYVLGHYRDQIAARTPSA
jgi:predicted DNA-binding ribbon-helix-helix protein